MSEWQDNLKEQLMTSDGEVSVAVPRWGGNPLFSEDVCPEFNPCTDLTWCLKLPICKSTGREIADDK